MFNASLRLSPISPTRLALLLGGPAAIALGCWIYLAVMIGDMSAGPGMSPMMKPQPFGPVQLSGLFLMWAVMMGAMMLPTAAPMTVAYARMRATERGGRGPWVSVLLFAGGYVATWSAFSAGATLVQGMLTELAYMTSATMKIAPGPLAGGVLIAAGVYQFLPVKQACLRQCRTPIGFLMTQWREGDWGAFVMGWRHGLFCVGCCWALMGLLFVVGVMNAHWIVALTIYVLIEKLVPNSLFVTRLLGFSLIGTGIWMMME
jgi:predicted metal-binding membrane protein